ncbi:SCO family protein [Flavicella marina]|uniref:SCO family protein n=1 Tax=Flavicella marina TaxID=1475951 RepID=UPI0012644263|nr:SCO family protein [Flavicella marina]
MKIISIKVTILFLLCFGCKETDNKSRVAHLPYYKDESFTPYWLVPGSDEEKNFHSISNFTTVNQDGDIVNSATFEDKIYVTDFFFTSCPGICPRMTANMKEIQDAFLNEKDLLLLSHSVTPEKDSVSVLKNYAVNKGAIAGKWHLVTGERTTIYRLGREQYFVENDLGTIKDVNDFLHTENFLLIDKNKHIRGIYNGLNRASINQLKIDIQTLLKE